MANEILKFAANVTAGNILTQASYATANPSPRTVGHVPGIASNQLENKVLTQASAVCNGIGDWLDTRQSVVADITDQLSQVNWLNAWDAAVIGSIPAATQATVGKSRYATGAEVLAGTIDTAAITPLGLTSKVPSTTVPGITRYATSAEVITGTLSTAAVTPNLLGPITSSMASNGFARLSGGLVIQWGISASLTANTPTAVSFPFTFPTACYQALSSGTNNNQTVAVVSFTTTAVTLNTNNTGTCRWIAVGN